MKLYQKYLKPLFDFIFALLLLPIFILTTLLLYILFQFYDKGNLFYISTRIGKNGKKFKMYKFRTMFIGSKDIRNNDNSTFNSSNDNRVTKIGKVLRNTSVDELPQILNVLKGQMSFIGPRPDLPDAIYNYTSIEKKRLLVKPGITGYSQSYFRNSINSKLKYENDVYYVANISLKFDIKIIFKTIIIVFKRKNIYN